MFSFLFYDLEKASHQAGGLTNYAIMGSVLEVDKFLYFRYPSGYIGPDTCWS